jgi:hypothetical protein
MAGFLMKFPSICCWILAVFAVSHVSSTGDELNKQKGDSSVPSYPKIEVSNYLIIPFFRQMQAVLINLNVFRVIEFKILKRTFCLISLPLT